MAKIKRRTHNDASAFTSDQVKVQKVGNRGTIISVVEPPRKSKSEKKLKSTNRFKGASKWAAQIIFQPGMKELYSKGINEKKTNSAFAVARRDFLTVPKIHYAKIENYAGAVGDQLRIKATDTFQVTALKVSISRKDGQLLEEGMAVRDRRKPVMWVYTTTVANPEPPGTIITVTAEDLPGNKALQELTIGNDGPGQAQITRSEVIPVKFKFFDLKSKKVIEV